LWTFIRTSTFHVTRRSYAPARTYHAYLREQRTREGKKSDCLYLKTSRAVVGQLVLRYLDGVPTLHTYGSEASTHHSIGTEMINSDSWINMPSMYRS
jgi:hypothetical protein